MSNAFFFGYVLFSAATVFCSGISRLLPEEELHSSLAPKSFWLQHPSLGTWYPLGCRKASAARSPSQRALSSCKVYTTDFGFHVLRLRTMLMAGFAAGARRLKWWVLRPSVGGDQRTERHHNGGLQGPLIYLLDPIWNDEVR